MRHLAPLVLATTTVVSAGAPKPVCAEPVERASRAAPARPLRAIALRRVTPTPSARRVRIQLRIPPEPTLGRARATLAFDRTTPIQPAPAPEIPWFWEALRSRVYSAMPHVQRRALTMTFAPVVVTGTEDTVPGLGISGDF